MLSNAYVPNHPRRRTEAVLKDSRILIVEDEFLIAGDYHFQLLEMGATPVGYKSTNGAALDFLENNEVDAVIVDFTLRDGKSEPVMRWLLQHRIPFVVITANKPEMRQWVGAVPILDKPVNLVELRSALVELLMQSHQTLDH